MNVHEACIAMVAGSDMRHDGMQAGAFITYPSIGAGFYIVVTTNGRETARSGFCFSEADNEAEWYEFVPPVVSKWGAVKPASTDQAASWGAEPAPVNVGTPSPLPPVSKWGKPLPDGT